MRIVFINSCDKLSPVGNTRILSEFGFLNIQTRDQLLGYTLININHILLQINRKSFCCFSGIAFDCKTV